MKYKEANITTEAVTCAPGTTDTSGLTSESIQFTIHIFIVKRIWRARDN